MDGRKANSQHRLLPDCHGSQVSAINDPVAPLAPATGTRGREACAVSPLSNRRGDVDRANHRAIRTTRTTPGTRTSTTATRTTTTSTIRASAARSADHNHPCHADFSFEELVQAYLDCRRHKRNTASARRFELDQEQNLAGLYEELQAGTWQPGQSICFVVVQPRPREVWAADFRDRIVHHLFYNRVRARFQNSFIADSYACIPGRGTLYGIRRLESKIRSITQNWSRPAFYLKIDIANFFVSINKNILFNILQRKVQEHWLLWLAHTILFHDPRHQVILQSRPDRLTLIPPYKSLFNQPAEHGLPIGNLSSQFFANIYLNELDQFIKHQLRAEHYVRYVDDSILLHESPQQLNAWLAEIANFLPAALDLQLNPKKTIIQPIARGVDFAGQVIKPWRTTLRRRTFNNILQRIDTLPAKDLYATGNSYFGLLRQATHNHRDRTRLAETLKQRGSRVNRALTKITNP